MEQESRRKGPRSPSVDSDDSSHRRRSRKYDRSPSPRRSRYRRSRSRDRRSGSRERRRKESGRSQDWKQQAAQPGQTQAPPSNSTTAAYVSTVHNQYQAPLPPNTSQPPPPIAAYNQGYNNYNYNYSQGYDYSYQQPTTGYRSGYPPPNWQSGQVPYNNQQAPPPPAIPQQDSGRNVESGTSVAASRPEDAKKEAIAAEAKQQKATLTKQREEYVKKSTTLQRELETLRQQCDEIGKEGGRENNRIVKENQKLQIEIQNKMKSIHNVIDMLTGIIGDKATVDDLRSKFKLETPAKRPRSPKEDLSKGKSESPAKSSISDSDKDGKAERERKSFDDAKPMYNFVHYDPEMHWCKVCDIFPKTAKEYLNHLHTNEHKEACLERKIVDMPWHERNGEGTEKEVPYYPGLPTKRTPIKGLQFFSAATSWYCKLCDSWIGDLHCASLHLKSKKHSENFSRFVDQNPHWETDWMADREKAFSDERHKQMQLELQKQKEDEAPPQKPKKSKKSKKNKKKWKKRKNRSSGSDTTSDTENTESDSDQDMSRSIRVAMRNKMKASTQAILNEEIDYHGIKLKDNWGQGTQARTPATPEMPPPENDDRQLLNSIRDKLKAKQEEEMKNSNNRRQSIDKTMIHSPMATKDDVKTNSSKKLLDGLEAWGPKEPPKSFWIKKDEEKPPTPTTPTGKITDSTKSDEIQKPHMGFWTKQQVNMAIKPPDAKSTTVAAAAAAAAVAPSATAAASTATAATEKDEEPRERAERGDRYGKDERDRKYDRRDDKYERSERYDRRRGNGGGGRDRERDRDRDRDGDYYDDRRKSRYSNDSPRRERNYRGESPKRGYDKYSSAKEARREENNSSNDESKFEKKTNESATKLKKVSTQTKKPPPPATKGKLPFIGRLPLFKKKNEEPKMTEKADIAPLPYQQSKFEDTPRVPSEIINPPGVVHITKLATPVNLNSSIPVKVIPAPMKILVAPPPPMLRNDVKLAAPAALTSQQVVDMEIEDQSEETIIEEPIAIPKPKKIIEPAPAKLPSLPPHPPPAINRPPPAFPPVVVQQQQQQQQQQQHHHHHHHQQPPPPQIPSQPIFTPNRPPPFVATAPPPPFVPAASRFTMRQPAQTHSPYVAPHDGASLAAAAASYAQAHGNPPPPITPAIDPTPPDISEIPEPAEKRPDPSIPLPDDLQEALNIIFPKEETAETTKTTSQQASASLPDTSVMYASMYSMLGCVGYGPEYMDQPPPEIMQDDTETVTQPGPDDLRMLGIDEGDTIF